MPLYRLYHMSLATGEMINVCFSRSCDKCRRTLLNVKLKWNVSFHRYKNTFRWSLEQVCLFCLEDQNPFIILWFVEARLSQEESNHLISEFYLNVNVLFYSTALEHTTMALRTVVAATVSTSWRQHHIIWTTPTSRMFSDFLHAREERSEITWWCSTRKCRCTGNWCGIENSPRDLEPYVTCVILQENSISVILLQLDKSRILLCAS